MATYTKKFSGKPGPLKAPPPQTTPDDKRSFDARPKPSNDRRREESARPTHHIDEVAPTLLDTPPGGED
jgi:hypothetical protein